MNEDLGRLPSEFAAMVEKAGLKAWQFTVLDASTFDPAKLRHSVAFFHAAWSHRSVQLLQELRKALDDVGGEHLPSLVVLDADAYQPGTTARWHEPPLPEWGETVWIHGGKILRRFTRRCKRDDLQAFLLEVLAIVEAEHAAEPPKPATPPPPELPDMPFEEHPLKLPPRDSGGILF